MKNLSESLVPVYGKSYSKRNLDYYKKFYLLFPEPEKVNTRVHNLEWSHIRRILSVTNPEAKYMTYMPTEEELRREIEQQKEFYRLQHKEK